MSAQAAISQETVTEALAPFEGAEVIPLPDLAAQLRRVAGIDFDMKARNSQSVRA